jgi:hypothetical protein
MTRKLVTLAVASALVLGLAACSDDDDGGGFGFPAGQGTTQPGANPFGGGDPNAEAGAGAGTGYTQASHDNFVNECGGFPGATGELCECAWGTITQTVPYADYQVFETGFAQGDTALPEWLTAAVGGCA